MTAINYFDKKNTANADKFENSLLSRGSAGDFIVSVGGHAIPQNNTLKMLWVTFDDKLNSKCNICNICIKAYL